MMKNKIFLFLMGCLFIVSCNEDFITKDNDKSRYTPGGFYTTKGHAEQALTAAYSINNNDGYGGDVTIMNFVFSDELYQTGYASGYTPWGSLSNFDVLANYSSLGSIWNWAYKLILAANVAIEVIPQAQAASGDPTFTDDVKNSMLGQAYFLRAHHYYRLFSLFPEDQLILRRTSPKSDAEFIMAPVPADSIFNFMVSDLKKAQALLVNSLNNTPGYAKGRVTRGSATALLGEVYMYRHMYTEAAAEFRKLMPYGVGDAAYGTYTLMPSYRDNFIRATENNDESIFEVQFHSNGQGNVGWGDGAGVNETSIWTTNWTLSRRAWDGGIWWNFAVPRRKLKPFEFWMEGADTVYDYRAYETFWGIRDGAWFTYNGTPRDYLAQGWHLESISGSGAYGIRKYAFDTNADVPTGTGTGHSDVNYRVIRLGDIMLQYAECLAKINDDNVTATDVNSAVYWVDKIRDRANNVMNDQSNLFSARTGVRGQLPTATALMAAKGWNLMQLVEHERYVELFGEGVRGQDIKRWQKDASYIDGKSGWHGYQSMTLLVPQSEIDANPNYQTK